MIRLLLFVVITLLFNNVFIVLFCLNFAWLFSFILLQCYFFLILFYMCGGFTQIGGRAEGKQKMRKRNE